MPVKALLDPDSSLSSVGPLIEDAKCCSHSFDQLLYSHIKRECNNVAHSLARFVIDISDFSMCMEDVSPQFFPVLQVDLAGLI